MDVGNNLIETRAKTDVELRETCSQKQRSERGKLDVWPQEGRKEAEMQSRELWRGRLV